MSDGTNWTKCGGEHGLDSLNGMPMPSATTVRTGESTSLAIADPAVARTIQSVALDAISSGERIV